MKGPIHMKLCRYLVLVILTLLLAAFLAAFHGFLAANNPAGLQVYNDFISLLISIPPFGITALVVVLAFLYLLSLGICKFLSEENTPS